MHCLLVKEWTLPPGPTTRMRQLGTRCSFSAEVEESGPKISWIDPTPVKVKQSEFSDKILKVSADTHSEPLCPSLRNITSLAPGTEKRLGGHQDATVVNLFSAGAHRIRTILIFNRCDGSTVSDFIILQLIFMMQRQRSYRL